jgi:putative membrane protein
MTIFMGSEMETSRYRRSGQRWALVWISAFLGVIGVIVVANLVFGSPVYYRWFPFGFGWIWIPFAFFFLFFALRWFFWPWGWGYRSGYWTGDDAYRILRERFARGEITREQFEQMSRDLEEHERI